VDDHLKGRGGVWDYLVKRWDDHAPRKERWIMWDIAIMEALADPGLAREKRVKAPVDSGRPIRVYTEIDSAKMEEDFWKALAAYRERGE